MKNIKQLQQIVNETDKQLYGIDCQNRNQAIEIALDKPMNDFDVDEKDEQTDEDEMREKSVKSGIVFILLVIILAVIPETGPGMNPVQTIVAVPMIMSGIFSLMTLLFSL